MEDSNALSSELSELDSTLQRVADGDLTVRLEEEYDHPELQNVAQSLNGTTTHSKRSTPVVVMRERDSSGHRQPSRKPSSASGRPGNRSNRRLKSSSHNRDSIQGGPTAAPR